MVVHIFILCHMFLKMITMFSVILKRFKLFRSGIHKRVCKALKATESTIDFGGFLQSLLICAQIKNNDTFKRSTAVLSSADSLQVFIHIYVYMYCHDFPYISK
jgi:hypothetical protein